MPFSLLLIFYLLFAVIAYEHIDIVPLLVCTVVGLVCGYFDYSRYLINKNVDISVCVLTITLFSSIFILNLNFTALIIVISFASLSMGAVFKMLFYSIYNLEIKESQSRKLNYSLSKSNEILERERKSLHKEVFEGEKREAQLKALVEQHIQSIWDLSDKNNQLYAQNRRFAIDLENIEIEKNNKEKELLSLLRDTSLTKDKVKEINELKQLLENQQEDLIRREKELYKAIERQKTLKNTESVGNVVNRLKLELNSTKEELERNNRQKLDNDEHLVNAKKSLIMQAEEKRNLEDKIKDILKEKDALIINTERLEIEKVSIQKDLYSVKNELNTQRDTNKEKEEEIKQQSLIISELKINEDFLNKWLDIETILIDHGYTCDTSRPVDLINYYYDFGKIDRILRDDLHKVRKKRNEKSHKRNIKIYDQDIKLVNDCYIRLKERLF